jgi:hypothetical protein
MSKGSGIFDNFVELGSEAAPETAENEGATAHLRY